MRSTEYFDLKHAEPVPAKDIDKPESEVFYLPLHVVHKESSTTTKVRAVTTDVSKMYRAIELVEPDRDLHRFIQSS